MYKSEIQTSSTESATNASSSQHLETETSYMSHDTSRLVKKKKTSTKALVKRLLGVVADLSSKVDHVLHKKDEHPTQILNQTEGSIPHKRSSCPLVLAVLHLDIWKVHIYDSARCMNYFTTYLTGGEFKSFGDSIIEELDAIDYWKDFPDGHKDNAVVEFIDIVDAPQKNILLIEGIVEYS
ncbi:unnamed protein product [Lactuca virosa]|uniref:Uncharacterized protein n=1 Tax=Lactuca virosa TaxID=75947 RepID=A0AAU9M4C0_9ASTR|nr:unnamed protein product [Lactuca virosa]